MKVVCDNCRAVYRVPDAKLTKAVNKATCRTCGHRMLIPRPKPGADPEERTLVTAVPPTPAGAPPRSEGHTRPMHEEEPESTLPGRTPDDLHRPAGGASAPEDFDGPSTVVSDMPPGHPSSSSYGGRGGDESQNTTLVQAPPGGRQGAPRRTPMPAAPRPATAVPERASVRARHSGGDPCPHPRGSDRTWRATPPWSPPTGPAWVVRPRRQLVEAPGTRQWACFLLRS